MHQALRDELIELARRQQIVTYGDVAPLVDLDMGKPPDRKRIAHLLAERGRYRVIGYASARQVDW